MLEEAISQESGEIQESFSVDLKLQVSGFLSPDLIRSDSLRLELYRRLSLCLDLASVAAIQSEIHARFGALDLMTTQFLQIIRIKILANQLKIHKISQYGQNITLFFKEKQKPLQAPSKDDVSVLQTILTALQTL